MSLQLKRAAGTIIGSCLLLPAPVAAQAAAASAPVVDIAAQPDPTKGVQEIIVTAQKREERLQDVPIAITSLTQTLLARSASAASPI